MEMFGGIIRCVEFVNTAWHGPGIKAVGSNVLAVDMISF